MAIIIYHNSRCSKSRGALELLREAAVPHEVHYYLEHPLTERDIRALLKKLNIPAEELVRKHEPLYKEEYRDKELGEDDWIRILAQHPRLIERPVVVNGDRAVIARPPERLHEIL